MSGSASLQKSLSRRVSFNEASIRHRHRHDSDTESQSDGNHHNHHCGSICSTCCFWISIFLGLLLFVLLIVGSMYFAFLRSNIPDVRLQRLDVLKIDVVSNKTDTLLSAEFVAFLNATNENGKAELVYSAMTATMSSAGIDFGKFEMKDMIEPPLSSMVLIVPASITNLTVEEAAANELQNIGKKRMLVFDVNVKGRIGVFVRGEKIIGFPFKIECGRIDQTEIEAGNAARCISQLTTPLR